MWERSYLQSGVLLERIDLAFGGKRIRDWNNLQSGVLWVGVLLSGWVGEGFGVSLMEGEWFSKKLRTSTPNFLSWIKVGTNNNEEKINKSKHTMGENQRRKRNLQWESELKWNDLLVSEELEQFGVWLTEFDYHSEKICEWYGFGVWLSEGRTGTICEWYGFMMVFFYFYFSKNKWREPIIWKKRSLIFISRWKSLLFRIKILRHMTNLLYELSQTLINKQLCDS